TLLSVSNCRGTADLARSAVARDLWRLADVGALRAVDVADPHPGKLPGSVHVSATVLGEDGQAHLEMVCAEHGRAALAVLVLQPLAVQPTQLAERIAAPPRGPGRARWGTRGRRGGGVGVERTSADSRSGASLGKRAPALRAGTGACGTSRNSRDWVWGIGSHPRHRCFSFS